MNNLAIKIYSKGGKKASLVFKKHRLLYRITTMLYADSFIKALQNYASMLTAGTANPAFIIKITCPNSRHRVLEIGLKAANAELSIYELEKEQDQLLARFKWQGAVDELRLALSSVK